LCGAGVLFCFSKQYFQTRATTQQQGVSQKFLGLQQPQLHGAPIGSGGSKLSGRDELRQQRNHLSAAQSSLGLYGMSGINTIPPFFFSIPNSFVLVAGCFTFFILREDDA
jgi:hypothetical protein